MAKLRYVQDVEKLKATMEARASSGGLQNTVQTLRAFYETDPEIVAALLPKPLQPTAASKILIQFSYVEMRPTPDKLVVSAAMTVGVESTYKGKVGWYVLAMPMGGEFVVIGGRERFGEPKKLADVQFTKKGDHVHVTCTRNGVAFVELEGNIAESLGAKKFTENLFCYKGMPGIANGFGFDGDVFLTQLNWDRDWDMHHVVEGGKITLRESAADPLVDVPVRKLLKMEYSEGRSVTGGEILEKVPGEWLQPFWFGRYDENPTGGIEIALASEAALENA
ncbi:hypothetical protein GCM10009093_01020 [Brevundimonas terrae]|uniref:Acetoacetate decarboxylase n=1 Tax=Brevundimonas terrae TaxID=363631 RepID=A0ABN0XZ76_9CAUL|nr:acetoacetate decarboxylase family protein [Brevundimonas terrae]NIJ27809.1 acetoacetate decarboxylase [Brevundimonas terrae]